MTPFDSSATAGLLRALNTYANVTDETADAKAVRIHGDDTAPIDKWDFDDNDDAIWMNGFAAGLRYAASHLRRLAEGDNADAVLAKIADDIARRPDHA